MEVSAVAKKRGPKPKTEGKREFLISFKCTETYKDWLTEYAESKRVTATQIIDMALAAMAEQEGFKSPPKR